MKRNKILTILLGFAIISGLVCTALTIAVGIQNGNTASAHPSSAKGEKYPQPYHLEKTKLEEFSSLSLQLEDSNVSIIPSDGYYLEYRLDGTHEEPKYCVKDGKLSFQEGNLRQKFHISWNLFSYPPSQEGFYLNLYVPKDKIFDSASFHLESGNLELSQLKAKEADFALDYGNLECESLTGGAFTLTAESGNLDFGDITCDDLQMKSEYGNITGDSFTIANCAELKLDSGNLELSRLSSGDLNLSNEYGNCTVDTFQAKDSSITMDSGSLKLREASLDTTDIFSEYGNVDLSLAGDASDYNFDMELEYGALEVEGKPIKPDEDGSIFYTKYDKQIKRSIQVRCESGNVTIK